MDDKQQLDELIDSGVARIRKTWNKLGSRKLGAGPYGKQLLLQEIYTVYCGWRDSAKRAAIRDRLADRLDLDVKANGHVLSLLIGVALPEIERGVVAMWVKAIRFGETHQVRPFKLRGCFYKLGGLARCAQLFAKEERARQERQEFERLDEEERQARINQARLGARRRRNAPKMPVGNFRLFD